MKVKNIIFMMGLLIGLIGLTTNPLLGQITVCNNDANFSATATSASGASNMDYILVQPDGTTIEATNSTGTFAVPATAGAYTLYAVNHDGTANLAVVPPTGACLEFITQTVTVEDAPDLLVTANISNTCPTTTADLTSAVTDADGGTVAYFESDGTTAVGTPAAVGAGTYVITSTVGSCSDSETITVSITDPCPSSGISACENESVTATATATGGATNLDYMLVCGGAVISTNATGTFDLAALGVSPGTCDLYAVNHDGTANLTVAPPTGACLEFITQELTVLDSPDLMVTANIEGACGAATADLTSAVTDADGGTLTYFESDGVTSVGTPAAVGAGSYVITSTIGTCSDSETVTVTLLTQPDLVVMGSISNTCPTTTADLTSAVMNADGGTVAYFESDGTTAVGTPAAVGAGTYVITSTVGTCSDSETVTVSITDPCPSAGISACENEPVTATATATGGATDLDYMLVCGGAVVSTNATGTFDLEALGVSPGTCDLYAVNHDGTANLTVAPPTGACLEFVTQELTVLSVPNLTVNSSLSNACPATTADLTIAVTSTGGGTLSYFESDGTTLVADETSVGAGTYVISSTNGTCTETATVSVSIISCVGVSVCEHEVLNVSATATGGATDLDYVLICGGAVVSSNTTGAFDMNALGVVAGSSCMVYAVNHDGTADLTTVPPSGACMEMIDQPVTVLQNDNALCDVPVPVELLSFTGRAEGKSNMLYWTTASEVNSDYFDVERSKDGVEFTYLGTVEAQGDSAIDTDYRLEDEEPYNTSYYRLKMVDRDETYEYSNIVLIKRESGNSLTISNIRPVPTINKAVIEFTSHTNGTADFTITDVTGKLLDKRQIEVAEGMNEYTYDFSNYTSAVYIITLNNEHSKDVKRMIKN